MGWEKRERGTRVYTRSRREGGRVVREYVGSGEIAELLAHADETRRRVRDLERTRGRAEVERLEGLAAPARELAEAAEVLVRAHLLAAGWHRHKGEWRRMRESA